MRELLVKRLFVKETSRRNEFVFKKLLNSMENPLRYRFSDPKKLVNASGIQAGQTVLEVGCGSGYFTPALSKLVGEEGRVESIDLHPMSVEATRQKMRELGKQNVQVSRMDAHETDFADASFDTIIVYGVVPAPFISEKRLSYEAYRLLKPGGTLAIWTVAPFWSPKSFMSAAQFVSYNKRQGIHRLQKPLS